MAIQPARRLTAIAPSPTLAISARAKELAAAGRNVLDLSAGEPDFTTPAHIRAAAIAALERGDTHYTPVDGTPTLKRAIAAKFSRENGLEYAANELIATCGAKQALFNLCLALLNPGDEVLIPAPYWVSYPPMVRLAEAEPVIVSCAADTGFKLTAQVLADSLTPKTRLVILNSPCNPSGAAYTRSELEGLAEVFAKHPDVFIATDDIYEHLLYRDSGFVNLPMAAPALHSRCIVVNGASKAYAMTGWRLGYAAGPAWLIGAMEKLQSQSTSNPASVSQAAAAAALTGDQHCVTEMHEAFRARRDRFVAGLNKLPGMHCALPDGAFYAFADCREVIAAHGLGDDLAFAEWLLEKAEIAAVPGSAFGTPGYVRFSYATDQATLDDALTRMVRHLG
ncbi:MAG: pyridoxal phosphate-dependent aminotransferase [Gammaproteobacteria bacterium]